MYQVYDLSTKNESVDLSTCRQISNLSIFPTKTKNRQIDRQAVDRFHFPGHPIENYSQLLKPLLIGVLGTQYQFLPWLGFIFLPQNFGIKYYTIFGCHAILLANFWYLHTTIFEDTFRPNPKVRLHPIRVLDKMYWFLRRLSQNILP